MYLGFFFINGILIVFGSLVSYRWDVQMPAIIAKSISILSDAGLGMAMFSLGQYQTLVVSFFHFRYSLQSFVLTIINVF